MEKVKKNFKKLTAMVLTLCMIAGSAGSISLPVKAASGNTTKTANVVVFVDFKDTSHAGHSDSECPVKRPGYVKELYDGDTAHPRAMKQYLSAISYGQLSVENIFPQMTGSVLAPYKLSGSADAYYGNDGITKIIDELTRGGNLSLPPAADQNGDKIIDNLTIVVPSTNDGKNDFNFNGHKSTYYGSGSLGGFKISSYNLIPEYGAFLKGDTGLLIHEFLHTMGYPDLYRGDHSGMPVGRWDIMASQNAYVQYPLAYLRSVRSGWFQMDTVTTSRSCSLYAASMTTEATKDQQALILKTGYSDSEFFVVEYRKQHKETESSYENWIPGSGLIVYRVNPSLNTNIDGSRDMIYVFRSGDSYDSNGREKALEIDKSWLSQESKRTSFGSQDPKASLEDDAIVYSDGTNSGIVISNVGSSAGNQITFDITFTDMSNQDYWTTVSEQSEYTYQMGDSFMDTDGVLYVLREGSYGSGLMLYKYDRGTWSPCSSALKDIMSSFQPQLEKYNGKFYVAGRGTDGLKLYRLDGSAWTHVNTITRSFNDFDMVSSTDGLYFAYNNEGAAPNQLSVSRYGLGGLVSLGTQISAGEAAYNPLIAAENGKTAVTYRSSGNQLRVKYYDAGSKTWKKAGDLSVTAGSGNIKIHKATIYLLRNGGQNANEMYTYDLSRTDSAWKKIGSNAYANESVVNTDICFHGDAPHIIYYGNTSKELRVVNLVNNQWTALGKKAASGSISEADIHSYGGNIYVVYVGLDAQNHVILKSRLSNNKSPVAGGNNSSGGGNTGGGNTSGGGSTGGGDTSGGGSTGGGNTGGNTSGGSTGGNTSGGSGNNNTGNSGDISNGTVNGGNGNNGGQGVVNTSGIKTLTVTMTKSTALRLSWSPAAGAKSYEIYYSTSPNSGFRRLASSKKTFYNFSKAKCGQTYYFKVRAGKKIGKKISYGDFCPPVSGRTVLSGTIHAYIAKSTYQSATIKWNRIKGAKKYEIYYSTSPSGEYRLLRTQGGCSFTHKGLQAGVTYYYKIRPIKDMYYGEFSEETSVRVVLNSLTKLKVSSSGTDRLKVSWKKVPGAAKYIILRSDRVNGTYSQIGTTGKTSYVDMGLTPSTAYYYKVYAVSGSYQTNVAGPVRQVTKALRP